MIPWFKRVGPSRAEKKELGAAYCILRVGGPPTPEPWDVVERLVVDWPAVREAWDTVVRISGDAPDPDRCHPYVQRRFHYALLDPSKPPTFEEAMWGEDVDDSAYPCDTTPGYDSLERGMLKELRIISRARERVGFLEKFSVEDKVYADRAMARAAADAWTASTGLKAELLRDDLLHEDGGWRIVPSAAVDELRKLIKRDG